MSAAGGEWLAHLLLRFGGRFAGLRRLPVIGPSAGWFSAKLVPRDVLTWIQIEGGSAAGLWMRVNPRTGLGVLKGGGEPAVQRALEEYLRPGMTFYDVGANIGFFSLLGAKLVGATGHVVAFEADPEIAARLAENIVRNGFGWAKAEQLAVWCERRSVRFARVDSSRSPDRGHGRVAAGNSGEEEILVDAVSLDDYCGTATAPDFIKCDVEGAEVEVFRGARRLFAEKRPIFLCEMHSDENRETLRRESAALGYRCTDCDQTHVLALPQ